MSQSDTPFRSIAMRLRFLRALSVVTLVLCGLFLVGSLAITLDGLHDDMHPADLAVVPGAQVLPDGEPSDGLRARLDQTVTLYRQWQFKLILVSGGSRGENYDEPAAMRRYLESQG